MIRTATAASLIFVATLVLGGCATIQDIRKDDLPTQKELAKKAEKMLSNEPSIVRLSIPKDAFQVHEPKTIASDRYVSVSMHNVEIRNLMKALAVSTNLNIVYNTSDKNASAIAGATPTGNKMVSVSFKGKLSDLFKTLSDSTGYFFYYENGAIVIKERETFRALVPNYPDLLKTIEGNLAKLGAEGLGYDDLSSSLSFKADYAGYQRIKEYLAGMKDNISLVTMRIIVMNVRLTNKKSLGVDWSKMTAVGYQSQKFSTLGYNSITNSASQAFNEGVGTYFNSTGANLFYESAKFSLSTLISFMETFGKSNIMQNVFVETMSGKMGKIEVVTLTPYISAIGVTGLSGNSSLASSTASTSTAKAGVTMDYTPYYNKKQEMLTINLKVYVEGVNRMVSLSAGAQLGSFDQPETTKKSIETFLRMKPDQVAIIGGLVYEANDNEVNGLPTDTYVTKNVTGDKTKEELVIVVKPTIIEFVPEG
jgi:type II secretory pathway component GspD/PulD (secretin)